MNLFEKILQLLSLRAALDFVDCANVVVHIFGVLGNAHLSECLQLFTLWHALKCVGQSYQILECSSQIPLRLFVLGA